MDQVPCQVLLEGAGVPQRHAGGVRVEGRVKYHAGIKLTDEGPGLLGRGKGPNVGDMIPARAAPGSVV